MTCPIELVLSRLQSCGLRSNGRDRWRARCPAHGGSNPSALSIGVGAHGQVLLKCWRGCTLESVVESLSLDLGDLFPQKRLYGQGSGPIQRRRLLLAAQALDQLDAETTLVAVCAMHMSSGTSLDESTKQLLLQAALRISMLRDEVRS